MIFQLNFLVFCFISLVSIKAIEVIQSSSDLQFDDNNRLTSHYLLYSEGDSCQENILSAWNSRRDHFLRNIVPMTIGFQQYFFDDETPDCVAVALEKGVPAHLIFHPFEEHKTIDTDVDSLKDWMRRIQQVEVGFVSYLQNDATIYWINLEGDRFNVGAIEPGELNIIWQVTTIGHRFEIVDDVTQEVVLSYTAQHHGVVGVGDSGSFVNPELDFTDDIEETLRHEWVRSRKVKRTFSALGFDKARLPSDVFASMSAYHYNNRDQNIREEWEHDNKGFFVNWWEADVYMFQMPWGLKRDWQRRLKPLVEQWIGMELDLQDIYGMRRYERGARLLTHVDREATHAASLIINVAQGGISEPWPVEIYDHGDRLHEIVMEEGEIVFYESAKALHGRNQPLRGGYYVNLFSHYRPKGEGETWYLQENSEHTPAPLIDLHDCKRIEVQKEDPDTKEVWSEPTTQCLTNINQNGEGTEVSLPTLVFPIEKLEGPEDLVNWWHKTVLKREQPHDEL